MGVWSTKVEGGACMADRTEIRRALELLIDPAQTFELRGLPSGRGVICRGDDLDAAVEAACSLSDGTVYWNLNPIQPTAERASKKTVLSRRWFLIDVDTIRPKEVSATEAEKAKCGETAGAILEHLMGQGWPAPVMVDSGNGWHLLYRIDLPNDSLSQQILKAAIYALGERFDNEHAVVDRSTHDAPRISKLPGTMARKGPDLPDRPHRMARIQWEPEALDVVPVDMLQAIGRKVEAGNHANGYVNGHTSNGTPWSTRANDGPGLTGYVKSAVDRECCLVALAIPGNQGGEGRNNALNRAAFNLGTMADWPEMDSVVARSRLADAARNAGLAADPGCGEAGIIKTIESGWEAGRQQGRKRPEEQVRNRANGTAIDPKTPLIVWAKDIKPKKVEWLWPGRIPVGKMTTFAGHGGLGKTFVLCDIAARVTRGAEWPFCGGECAEQGKVLFISGEDDEDDTLVPRLIECEADLSKVAFLSPESHDHFSLAALELLSRVLDQMHGVKFVVIDPPTSYLDGVDDHKNAELRGLLTPLKRWAAEKRVAIVLNNHVNKATGKDVEAAARVMGSVAWVNAVRAAHLFVRGEEDNEKVIFAPIKINVGRFPMALSYRIASTREDLARVEWLAELDQTADETLQAKKKTRGASAVDWLTGLFSQKREWPSDELRQMAKECGVSKYALFESPEVKALPIKRDKRHTANGEQYWVWVARPGWPEMISESSESRNLAPEPVVKQEDTRSRSSNTGSESRDSSESRGDGLIDRLFKPF